MANKVHCERALDRFEEHLGRLKNVVGLGIVPIEESDGQSGSKDLAVAVYVRKKMPLEKLAQSDRVPKFLRIPGKHGDILIPVRVIEQGLVEKETLSRESLGKEMM